MESHNFLFYIWLDKKYLIGGLEHEFYDFPSIGDNNPDCLIFFRAVGVETTKQILIVC